MALERIEMPIAGRILKVNVSVGQEVKEGDIIGVMESMKMEIPIFATINGIIKEIAISPGQIAKAHEQVATIEY